MQTSNNKERRRLRLHKMLQDARRRKKLDDIFERTQKKKSEMETVIQNLGLIDTYSDTMLPLLGIEGKRCRLDYLDLNEWNYSAFGLQDGLLRLSVYEQYLGMSWFSACYPLDLKLIYENQQTEWRILSNLVNPLLQSTTQEQLRKLDLVDDDKKKSGTSLNVASLLTLCDGHHLVRHDGEQIVLDRGTFSGKYVLVCCFNVPVLWGIDDSQSLLNLCYELVSDVNNFEMVMVARMNSLADTQTVFDNFFKALPASCLAVPYEESQRREQICKKLNLGVNVEFRLYNTNGKVLPPFTVNFMGNHYGAEAFPFTKKIVKKIEVQRRKLRKSNLDQLLRLRPSDSPPAVYKFNPAGGPREEAFISDLMSNKHVGLYMCTEGSLTPLLHKLYAHCRSKQLEFEIVVLYCPFLYKLDPEFFKAKIDRLLQEQNVCGWWCLPFNNSVSLRFWGLTGVYDNGSTLPNEYYRDKLIIVGTDGKILDMYGAEVIKYYGMDAYPFTREARVKEEMKKMREITLGSILVADLYRGFDWRNTVSFGELVSSKKKVIIYMDILHDPHTAHRQVLVSKYNKMKKKRSTEFEIVFIDSSYEDPESREMEEVDAQKIKEMPWLVYPNNGKRTSSLKDLRKLVHGNAVVGFGEDGRVCAYQEMPSAAFSCLNDTLYQDLYRGLGFGHYREI